MRSVTRETMRTLLVDNYDSYTYNLYQLIAAVTGVEPAVLRNDSPGWDRFDLSRVDCAVISPGPGHPGRPRDVGRCGELLSRAELPVLGVCLGMQAIGLLGGASVEPAPVPRHGWVSRVRHGSAGLFAGVPQDFRAVRYHSLRVAEPLPPGLEPLAWAEDGVLMALRHRDRPQWGVQFHPESVATEHGAALLRNFLSLAAAARRSPVSLRGGVSVPAHVVPVLTHDPEGPVAGRPGARAGSLPGGVSVPAHVVPVLTHDPEEPLAGRPGARAGSLPGGVSVPAHDVPVRTPPPEQGPVRGRMRVVELPVAVDAERAFAALYRASPSAFWLDSSSVHSGLSRFSFLGDAAGPLAEVLTYRVGSGGVDVAPAQGAAYRVPGTIFDVLDARLRGLDVERPPLPFELACGYVGYFGYELKADCGGAAAHRAETPDAVWLFVDRMVAIDHAEGRTYLLALDHPTSAAWLAATAARLRALPALRPPPPAPPVAYRLGRGPDRYLADIAECQRQLRAGESYEICLTDTAVLPAPGDPFEAYRRLRRGNPAPYAAYLRHGGLTVASSSPERFLRITADRTVESRPIKGTAPRGADPLSDVELRESLAASAKTRAENLMIVDLLRNDLGRVCEIGSVSVPRLMATESYATVHQLVSTVHGRLRPEVSAVDCARLAFPGGSMTGAPKLRTMEILDRLETAARGVYSGALGWFGPGGTADLSIVIRTLVTYRGRATVGAGGAIVLDSIPAAEYAEMLLKVGAVLPGVLGGAAAGGTPERPIGRIVGGG